MSEVSQELIGSIREALLAMFRPVAARGNIRQKCGEEEEDPYWEAPEDSYRGTICITNTGDCKLTATISRLNKEDKVKHVKPGQTKCVFGDLVSLTIECMGSEGRCTGSFEVT